MKKKKQTQQKNPNDLFKKIQEASEADKKRRRDAYQERYDDALNSIYSIVGKKEIGTYTREDVIAFIKKKYNATEISFTDSLDYYYQYTPISLSSDPVSYLTEGMVSGQPNEVELFSFPPLAEPFRFHAPKKNGLILVLKFKENKLKSMGAFGNERGYNVLFIALRLFLGETDFPIFVY